MSHTHAPTATPPTRVRRQVRDALVLMAFSLVASLMLAAGLLALTVLPAALPGLLPGLGR